MNLPSASHDRGSHCSVGLHTLGPDSEADDFFHFLSCLGNRARQVIDDTISGTDSNSDLTNPPNRSYQITDGGKYNRICAITPNARPPSVRAQRASPARSTSLGRRLLSSARLRRRRCHHAHPEKPRSPRAACEGGEIRDVQPGGGSPRLNFPGSPTSTATKLKPASAQTSDPGPSAQDHRLVHQRLLGGGLFTASHSPAKGRFPGQSDSLHSTALIASR
jgi:hypothetical protein